MQLRKEFGQDGQRVWYRSAVYARVQVTLRPGQFDLVVVQPAQPVGDRRHALTEHRRVRDHQRVGRQLFPVVLYKVPEADASYFLFTFDQDLDVDGETSVHLVEGFESFQV